MKDLDNNCVFCKVVSGEFSSYKIAEDEKFIAILDLCPNVKGMTLIITKEHFDSYAAEMGDEIYSEFFLFAKKVSKLLDDKLGVKRTALVMEGMGINHAHIKLYPLHGLESQFKEMLTDDKIFFDEYKGYISTMLGPKATEDELNQVRELFL
ncbi:MAG TPA: HIT domain-containing protein [Ignavibacteria bacterium]|nr:HIT domain-containing protein [Ignavibacteria bacterium]